MKKRVCVWMAAAACALVLTACGDGSSIVINGTTAPQEADGGSGTESVAEAESSSPQEADTAAPGGPKIDIITGETVADTSQAPPEETLPTAPPETTAAPTTAAPTTAAPATTAAPTTAAREYEVRDLSKTMYANSSVRVRAGYSTSTDILGSLAEGESVQITGESDNGWMRVNWKGLTGYVSKSYLTDTPPETTAAASETRPTSTQAAGTSPGTTPSPGTNNQTPQPGSQGPAVGPGAPQSPGSTGTGSTGTNGSVSGTVLQFDPSGVTIQLSNGSTQTFSWGSAAIPADLQPGSSVQVTYQGNTLVTISR